MAKQRAPSMRTDTPVPPATRALSSTLTLTEAAMHGNTTTDTCRQERKLPVTCDTKKAADYESSMPLQRFVMMQLHRIPPKFADLRVCNICMHFIEFCTILMRNYAREAPFDYFLLKLLPF